MLCTQSLSWSDSRHDNVPDGKAIQIPLRTCLVAPSPLSTARGGFQLILPRRAIAIIPEDCSPDQWMEAIHSVKRAGRLRDAASVASDGRPIEANSEFCERRLTTSHPESGGNVDTVPRLSLPAASAEQCLDIALAAVHAFLKRPLFRSPKERAFIEAMGATSLNIRQKRDSLRRLAPGLSVEVQMTLLVATYAFAVPAEERCYNEHVFVREMTDFYLEVASSLVPPTIADREIELALSLIQNLALDDSDRSAEDRKYIHTMRDFADRIGVLEAVAGLPAESGDFFFPLISMLKSPRWRMDADVERIFQFCPFILSNALEVQSFLAHFGLLTP